ERDRIRGSRLDERTQRRVTSGSEEIPAGNRPGQQDRKAAQEPGPRRKAHGETEPHPGRTPGVTRAYWAPTRDGPRAGVNFSAASTPWCSGYPAWAARSRKICLSPDGQVTVTRSTTSALPRPISKRRSLAER